MDWYTSISDALISLARSAWDGSWTTSLADIRSQLAALPSNANYLTGVSIAQIAAAAISAVFVFVIVVAMARRRALVAAPSGEAAGASVPERNGPLRQRWEAVIARLGSTHEADWKVAVIEADKLVDDAMSSHGYAGESFGDRLMNIEPGALVSLDGLWWAHRIRNRLAHEPDFFLRYTEARQALSYYEQTLRELNLV
ncbi:MAG TPA: hypothetical protein VMJ72_03180 [Candidatus Paceibacterota bacterium]|nr:hypothetical protein [Candidatus Paceibacterota bacterium]